MTVDATSKAQLEHLCCYVVMAFYTNFFRIFHRCMSRIFHPCSFVSHFRVSQVHVPHFQHLRKRSHRRLITPLDCEWIRPILTPSNTWFLRSSRVSPVFAQHIRLHNTQTDKQTDMQTALCATSVAIDRILCTREMREMRLMK